MRKIGLRLQKIDAALTRHPIWYGLAAFLVYLTLAFLVGRDAPLIVLVGTPAMFASFQALILYLRRPSK